MFRKVLKKISSIFRKLEWKFSGNKKQKVFCIGRNKTGTTSVEAVLKEFGYKLGHQPTAELLLEDYRKENWNPILNYCNTAQAFQDAPFSWPDTWRELIKKYPNAKYILTYRDEEGWYNSITSFHSKLWADGKRIPTKEDLQSAEYRYKGFAWECNRVVYDTPENNPYEKTSMIDNYNQHNVEVLEYFNEKKNFLALNISEKDSYDKLCLFLNKKPIHKNFPHLNKT